MRKHNFLYIFILMFTILSCHSYQSPTFVAYDHFKVKKINLKDAEITLDLHYINPNNVGFILKYIDIDILANDSFLAHAKQHYDIRIHKKAAFTIPLKLSIDMKSLLKNSISSILKDKTAIKITGKITIEKGRISKSFPIQYLTEQNLSLL